MAVEEVPENVFKAFIKGLDEYGLKYDDVKDNWKYCGGDTGRHLNYFKMVYGHTDFPEHSERCICGHFIVENCYITNDENILVLGNCCIKKFIKKQGRTCESCGEPHKNRSVNKCNACREWNCSSCGQPCGNGYRKCLECSGFKRW